MLASFSIAFLVFAILLSVSAISWTALSEQYQDQGFGSLFISGQMPEEYLLAYLFGAGVVLSFLAAVIAFLLSSTRNRVERSVEKKTAELVSSRELFLNLYKQSLVPYLLIDGDGAIYFPNHAAVRFFDKKLEELRGQNIFGMLGEESKEHVEVMKVQLKEGLPIADQEIKIMLGGENEPERWAIFSVFPFTKEKNTHHGLVTLVDITKQKEIDRAKSEFVSLASHQLRTPISALKWNIELMESENTGELNEKQQKYLGKILSGTLRMENIIEDFLNVSRLELGTLIVDKHKVDLRSVVEGVLDELVAKIETKHLNVHTEFELSSQIVTDPQLITMIMQNLISNAVKYTPEGGDVTIAAIEEGSQIRIHVEDTGVGIPVREQDQLFSKLFRASNVRSEVKEGTGLGLYIVKMTLGVLGGTIEVSSEEGRGTTFIVTLPI